jgi:hypothetical protein
MKGDNMYVSLQLLQILKFTSDTLSLFKPLLTPFLTTLLTIKDFDSASPTLASDLDSLLSKHSVAAADPSLRFQLSPDDLLAAPASHLGKDKTQVLHTLRQVVSSMKANEGVNHVAELGAWVQGKGVTARAQYECAVVERAREVAGKAAAGLNSEEVAVIRAVMRSVEELAAKVQRDGERVILEHLSDKMSPRDADLATKIVLEASKCRGNDSKI